jgi:hypothetical protein
MAYIPYDWQEHDIIVRRAILDFEGHCRNFPEQQRVTLCNIINELGPSFDFEEYRLSNKRLL